MSERVSAMSHADFLNTRNFPGLDGLRAVSVFLVFSDHFGGPGWTRFAGWLGVHAFFVLSGFLITTLLMRERDGTGQISLTAFYIRRTTRLLPLYAAVLLTVLALAFVHQDQSWDQMKAATPYYLTLLNELAPPAPLLMTWTLGVEWKYYLLWPALLVTLGATPASRLALAGACVALLAAVAVSGVQWSLLDPRNYIGMLLGSTLAMLMHSPRSFAWLRPFMRQGVALVVMLALVLVHRRFFVLAGVMGQTATIALYGLLIAMLIPALVSPRDVAARAFSAPWLVFIGHRSYAMYLVQFLAAHAVIGLMPDTVVGFTLLATSFAVALAVSDLLYRWFERPLTQWGHRWARRAKVAKQLAQLPTHTTVHPTRSGPLA